MTRTSATILFLLSTMATEALAAPGQLTPGCVKQYALYQAKPASKAFATSSNGYCGWAWRTKSSSAELEVAKNKALGYCMQYAGTECRVVEQVK